MNAVTDPRASLRSWSGTRSTVNAMRQERSARGRRQRPPPPKVDNERPPSDRSDPTLRDPPPFATLVRYEHRPHGQGATPSVTGRGRSVCIGFDGAPLQRCWVSATLRPRQLRCSGRTQRVAAVERKLRSAPGATIYLAEREPGAAVGDEGAIELALQAVHHLRRHA